jgi:hypothetical protein
MNFNNWWALACDYARITYGISDLHDQTFGMDCYRAGWSVREYVEIEAKHADKDKLKDAPPYDRAYDSTTWETKHVGI